MSDRTTYIHSDKTNYNASMWMKMITMTQMYIYFNFYIKQIVPITLFFPYFIIKLRTFYYHSIIPNNYAIAPYLYSRQN